MSDKYCDQSIQSNVIRQEDNSKNVQTLITKPLMDQYNERFKGSDEFLSIDLLSLANRVSSSRANMFNSQISQGLMLLNPDVPFVYTGYEHEVGKYSKSYYQSDRGWKIIHKISRYKNHPDLSYYLVICDQNGVYDVIQRKAGEHLTESFAYMLNNTNIDSKKPGDMIQHGEVLYKSTAFDESMNYRYGKNAKTLYLSCAEVTEDAIWASDEFCDKLEYCTITSIEATCNGNEIFTNLYGDDSTYKAFPDISEDSRLNVLCSKRKVNSKSIIHNLSDANLRRVIEDEDTVYYTRGKVIGVDVFSNKDYEEIDRNPCNAQIMYYYDEQHEYYKEIRSKLGKIITNNPGKVSDRLLHIYHRSNDLVSGKTIVKGNSRFEGFVLIFTVMDIKKADKGSKISGRFGEKGVIGRKSPASEMPTNEYGEHVDLVLSPQGVFGRLNLGQWTEQELTFLSDNICRDLRMNNIPADIGMPKIIEFYTDVNKETGTQLAQTWYASSPQNRDMMYKDIVYNGLYIHQPPFWGNVGFTELRFLYNKYPYPRYKLTYKGDPIIRRGIMGIKYVMLLKQTPESKYSARSLGMQSSLGHPSKSIKYKQHQIPHSNTPIRIGEMELMGGCIMNDAKAMADFLKIYANSQMNRERFVSHILSTSNPLDVTYDVVDDRSINRKMLNALFKSVGSTITS